MALVVDASVVAAWLTPDETAPLAERALKYMATGEALVPGVFWHELRNILIVAERRQRIGAKDADAFLAKARVLALRDEGAGDDREVMRLCRTRKLSAYDAAYLELAKARKARLATLDAGLRAAAAAERVALYTENT